MAYLTRSHLNVDDLFNQFFAPPALKKSNGNGNANRAWTPYVNVKETEEGYTIEAELPGLKPEQVEIEFQEDTLTLKGARTHEEQREGETWHLVERRHGSFERSFRFPTLVDAESFDATFTNGLLTIAVKKAAEVKPRKIAIKSAE